MAFSSIPLSSQSAPIDEFVILWTADKHKKLKKWHDGYLRYHTFNKRLMVYDHLNNKVCDRFLTEYEPIDIGDELVFESHLITIEDIKGRQSQDLRPLFEKTVDRRKTHSTTATPVRRAGTEAPTGQSPTPTLLRTIRSRPPTGEIHAVYPSPAPRAPQRGISPPLPPTVPQKRTAQGTPIVQKIVYKPFNVPKLKDDIPSAALQADSTPSRPPGRSSSKRSRPTAEQDEQTGHRRREGHGELAADLFGADDDFDMLELDLDKSDFAAKPSPAISKPPPRARPNAPPPFKPPLVPDSSSKVTTGGRAQLQKRESSSPIPLVISSPIPPEVAPSASTKLKKPPRASVSPSSSENAMPADDFPEPVPFTAVQNRPTSRHDPVFSPVDDGRQGHVGDTRTASGETRQLKSLALTSAASRTRRGLLCGPSRSTATTITQSVARHESALLMPRAFGTRGADPPRKLDANRKVSGVLSVPQPGKVSSGKGTVKPGSVTMEGPRKDVNDKNKTKGAGEAAMKLKEDYRSISKPDLNAIQDERRKGNTQAKVEQTELANLAPSKAELLIGNSVKSSLSNPATARTKSNKKTEPSLQIFSSDDEELGSSDDTPAAKKTKTPARKKKALPMPQELDSTSSSDEFESLRLSGLPNRLVQESRNYKLLQKHSVSEASRVWRENEDR
ncbi:hypothetical protein DRE_07374 [Drechslerella stenobrocha 248]|uniref:5'-3' DNA helicase ZGRF1-like N-terminal domain-containing protein n=1 Tax=Drechslerella stenobrocha 248 TaxID=1043628 RepID=W7HIN2_9PEZI|nr:hypothetical protein DRE_07374 [Drechslerella stenobrocha 248]